MSNLAIATSPSSSAASTSPPPPTPLTPQSAHNVTFSTQPNTDQFAFDGLNIDNGIHAPSASQGGPVRRKPSRRANTAERRATHNAVERQRRETLNGRFLDLAALLPNLASVRRPSKSAIVNSSIALIHTQRRARSGAARELRVLKLEADALRAEVNEWRERAGMNLGRVEEPPRTREFEELVSGALEEAEEGLLEEERRALEIVKEGLRMDASALGGGNDLMMNMGGNNPFAFGVGGNMYGGLAEEDDEDGSSDGQPARMRPGSQGSGNGIPSLPMPIPIPRHNSSASMTNNGPMIFDPSAALLHSHSTHQGGISNYLPFDLSGQQSLGLAGLSGMSPSHGGMDRQSHEKLVAWNNQFYNSLPQNNYQGQSQMFTPPTSAHTGQMNNNGGFLGGFGLRDDDNTDSSSNCSGSISDFHGFNAHQAAMTHRTRSTSAISAISPSKGALTPPSSAPATTTTYAEANNAGDALAAAYAAFPGGVNMGGAQAGWKKELSLGSGGGNTYGAAMGLFM